MCFLIVKFRRKEHENNYVRRPWCRKRDPGRADLEKIRDPAYLYRGHLPGEHQGGN